MPRESAPDGYLQQQCEAAESCGQVRGEKPGANNLERAQCPVIAGCLKGGHIAPGSTSKVDFTSRMIFLSIRWEHIDDRDQGRLPNQSTI